MNELKNRFEAFAAGYRLRATLKEPQFRVTDVIYLIINRKFMNIISPNSVLKLLLSMHY